MGCSTPTLIETAKNNALSGKILRKKIANQQRIIISKANGVPLHA